MARLNDYFRSMEDQENYFEMLAEMKEREELEKEQALEDLLYGISDEDYKKTA